LWSDLWYTYFVTYPFQITLEIQQANQAIEQAREQIEQLLLPKLQAERLRTQARVRAAHFSTWLDGSSLSLDEAITVLIDGHKLRGREVDVLQLKRVYQALERIEAWSTQAAALDEEHIRKLHAVLAAGRRAKASPYLPEPHISARMAELVAWLNQPEIDQPTSLPGGMLPGPLLAGVAHYQINAIQPFSGFNARLGRSLATWVLYRGGYLLLRCGALEEFLATDVPAYHAAAAAPDLTIWLSYFCTRLAAAYASAALEVSQLASSSSTPPTTEASTLPQPDKRAMRVLRLFATQNEIAAKDVMRLLGLPPRQASELLEAWVAKGWLAPAGARYRLSADFKRNFDQIMQQNS
jgi:Fic family protein